MIRRGLEVGITLIIMIIFLLPGLITMFLVRLKMGTPVLFKQERTGLHMKSFYIYKFRTLTNEVDERGDLLPDALRLTPFGRVLRKLSLDELPQLINVLKGDMSLIGPRPLLVHYNPFYTVEERKRFMVKPGITGLAQVSGRNLLDWDSRLALDVKYVNDRTLWLDFKILLITCINVIRRKDIVDLTSIGLKDLDIERGM